MTTLVLGGSGLVGCALRRIWTQRRSTKWLSRAELDLSRSLPEEGLPSEVSTIIYLAQARNSREFPSRARETFTVNVDTPLRLMERYVDRGLRQFVYASSGNVHWAGQRKPGSSSVVGPDFYSATKVASEALLRAWENQVGVAIIRLFTVYGPGADPNSLVSRVTRQIAEGRAVELRGPDGDLFQPTHSMDVAVALDSIVRSGWTGIADVAGPAVLSLRRITEALSTECTRPTFSVIEEEPADFSSRGPMLFDSLPETRPMVHLHSDFA